MRLARLTQRKQFLAAAEHGRRFRSSVFTVQVRDRRAVDVQEQDGQAQDGQVQGEQARDVKGLRLGLTASRKVGHAVERNRIRRRLRAAAEAAFAAQADHACDVVIVARAETLTADYAMLVAELSGAIDRARPARPRHQGPSKAQSTSKTRRPQDAGSARSAS